jgi:hypothetical protein
MTGAVVEPDFIGTVAIFGEKGKKQIAKSFLDGLGNLSPTKRRLALARACAFPWRDKPEDLPDCYKRELEMASFEADEEDLARGATPNHGAVADLFASEEPPINEIFLRQLVPLGPSDRRHALIMPGLARWGFEGQTPPEWIMRSWESTAFDATREWELQTGEDSHG